MTQDSPKKDHTAYFVPAATESERGPGVLVLHSWWGLTPHIKEFCNRLADLGYCVLAPNFFDAIAINIEAAQELLTKADANDMADLTLSSIHALRTYSDDSREPIAIVGFAMGGSLGLWASTKLPQSVAATVSVYGTQDIDFVDSESEYLLVSASDDEVATADDMSYTQAVIGLGNNPIEAITIDGTSHGFAESIDPSFNEEATEKLYSAVETFLADHFRSVSEQI